MRYKAALAIIFVLILTILSFDGYLYYQHSQLVAKVAGVSIERDTTQYHFDLS